MQKTIAQQRAEMKARFSENLRKLQEIEVGKAFFSGRYSFLVEAVNEETVEIAVFYSGKFFRNVTMVKSGEYFFCHWSKKMTAALLNALCHAFVSFTTTGAKNAQHLDLHRACWFGNSSRIFGYGYPNPFGV